MPIYYRLSKKAKNGVFYSTPKMVLARNKSDAAVFISLKHKGSGKWDGFKFISAY